MTRSRRSAGSAGAAALAVAAGVVVVLLSSSPTWIRATLRVSTGQVKLTGGNAASAAVPLALVAAAGLIAIALVRSWLRRVLAVFIAAAGVGVVIVVIRVVADPVGIARRSNKVSSAGQLAAAHLTAAPYLCLLGALLIMAGAGIAVLFSGRWPKYAWDALESGEDPTLGNGG